MKISKPTILEVNKIKYKKGEILSPVDRRGARTHIKPRGYLKTDVVNMNLASYLNPISTIVSESIGMIAGKIGFKHSNICIFFSPPLYLFYFPFYAYFYTFILLIVIYLLKNSVMS